jgi:hypothetical protein
MTNGSDLPPERKRAPQGMSFKIGKMTVFVDNALNAEIQARFVPQGYGPPKIAQGVTLKNDGQQKFDRNLVLEGNEERATKVLMDKWKDVDKKWSLFVDACYATMRTRRDLLDALGLVPRGAASQSFSFFVNRARSSYEVALATPEILGFLAGRGYPVDRLNAERTDIQVLIGMNDAQEAAKGLAQASTHDLKASMDGMWRWYEDGAMMARRALRDRHDLLEMLGILAREKKRKKKPV